MLNNLDLVNYIDVFEELFALTYVAFTMYDNIS